MLCLFVVRENLASGDITDTFTYVGIFQLITLYVIQYNTYSIYN